MKCSSCGSDNLISVKNVNALPFNVVGDARLGLYSESAFICLDCGHIDFYNYYFVEQYKTRNKRKYEISQEIESITKQINELTNTPFNEKKYVDLIKKCEDEIQTIIKLGCDERSIETRKDMIREYQSYIDNKRDPDNDNQIKQLKNQLVKLQQEQSDL